MEIVRPTIVNKLMPIKTRAINFLSVGVSVEVDSEKFKPISCQRNLILSLVPEIFSFKVWGELAYLNQAPPLKENLY